MGVRLFLKVKLATVVLKFGNADARAKIAIALGRTRSRHAVTPLIAALNDSNSIVRFHAADALAEIGDRRALKPLETVYNKRDEDLVVLTAALHALRVLDPAKYGAPYITVKAKY